MKEKILQNFSNYLKGLNMELSQEEILFLENCLEDLQSEDLIIWLKSNIRKIPIIFDLFQGTKLTREQFLALSRLDDFTLTHLIRTYGNEQNNESIIVALIATAYLDKYILLDKDADRACYNKHIIENLIKSQTSDKLNKLELIRREAVYHNPSLVDKIIKRENLTSTELELINELLDKIDPYSSDIASKYVDLMLDKKPSQIEEVDPKITPSDIIKLDRRKRAKDAILLQDSFDKVKEVMYAALNNGIYRKKEIFRLIQRESDERKMRILRIMATHNRIRKNIYYLAFFSGLDLEHQEKILENLGETDRKIKNSEKKSLRKRRTDRNKKNFIPQTNN